MKTKTEKRGILAYLHEHYHWIVAVVSILMLFSYGGAGNNLTSLHIIPVSEHLGISRATFSLTSLAQTSVGTLATFLSGFFISRFGSRMTSTVALLAASGAYVILANVGSVWMLAVGRGILGLASGFCTTAAASHITRIWFHRHEGTVLGIITASTGIGGSLVCIVQTALMEKGGFSASFYFCAAFIAFSAVLVFLFIRNHPGDIGLEPLGEGEEITGKKRRSVAKIAPGLPMKTLVKRPAFYLMILCTFLVSLALYMAYGVIRPYLVDCGFSESVASGFHSAMLLFLTFTKIMIGVLADRFGAKKVVAVCSLLTALGLAAFGLIGILPITPFTLAVIGILIYASALPMVTVGTSLIAFTLFGHRAQTKYTGIFLGIITTANFFADYLSNLIQGFTGSYQTSFFAAAGIAVASFVLYLVLYRLAGKDMERADAK